MTITATTHAADQVVRFEKILPIMAAKLTALIGMNNWVLVFPWRRFKLYFCAVVADLRRAICSQFNGHLVRLKRSNACIVGYLNAAVGALNSVQLVAKFTYQWLF